MENAKFCTMTDDELQRTDGGLVGVLVAGAITMFGVGFAAGHAAGVNNANRNR